MKTRNLQTQPFQINYTPLDRDLYITSEFGLRNLGTGKHYGIDFRAGNANQVFNVADGEVIRVIKGNPSFGNVVIIKHDDNVLSLYAHLDIIDPNIIEGKKLEARTMLGNAGKTGTTVNHLHFELIDGNVQYQGDTALNQIIKASQDPKRKLETGIPGNIARLNSRPYFANYAINQVIKQMADNSSDLNFDSTLKNNDGSYKTYNQITDSNQKTIIDQRSSDIFSTTIITDEYGREREGDIRSNTIIKSANSKIGLDSKTNQYVPSKNVFTFKDLDGNDTYQIEPPLFGQINITDSKENSKLILDGKEITESAIAIKDQNTGEVIKNSWLLKHTTSNNTEKQYLLQRINSNASNTDNKNLSDSGTDLLITPLPQTTTENCIRIKNFPFTQALASSNDISGNTVAPFGIKLSYIKQIDLFFKIKFNEMLTNVGNINAKINNYRYKKDDGSTVDISTVNVGENVIDTKETLLDSSWNVIGSSMGFNEIRLIALKNNNLVCCWEEIENSRIDNKLGISYQILSSDGKTKIGGINKIYNNSDSVPHIFNLNIAPLEDNKFVIDWSSGAAYSGNTSSNHWVDKFYAMIYDENGTFINQHISIMPDPYYSRMEAGVSPGGDNIMLRTSSSIGYIYRLLDSNGNDVTQYRISIDPTKLPTIQLTKIEPITQNATSLAAIDGDNNIFQIASADAKCSIDGFCGVDGSNDNDKLDFSPLLIDANENVRRRMLKNEELIKIEKFLNDDSNQEQKRFLQDINTNQLNIKHQQNNLDTIITSTNFPNLEIILKNFDQKNLKQNHFITDTGIGSNINLQFFNQTNTTIPNNNTNSTNSTLPNNGNSTLPNNNTQTNTTIPHNTTTSNNNSTPPSNNTNSNNNTGTNTTNSTTTTTTTNSSNNTITVSTTPIEAQITGTNQTLSFDQMAASIPFNNITITPINKNDKFEVKLILTDSNGNPIPEAKITMGETEDNKYRSNYDEKTGIWSIVENFDPYDDKHITGTAAQVTAEVANELLKGNAIHTDINFKPKNLIITPIVTDITNNKIYNSNQIHGNYQCLEIPDDLVSGMIGDQKSPTNQTLIMNFLNYLKDPRDRRFIGAEFELVQAIKNNTMDPISDDSLLQIRKLNETAFEINGNKPGNYTMDFSLEQCNKVIDRYFNLEMIENGNSAINITNGTNNNTNSNNTNSNLTTIIGASVGGAALITAIGVAIWQRDKIKQCFNYLTGGGRSNEGNNPNVNNVIDLQLPIDNINPASNANANYQSVNSNNIEEEKKEVEEIEIREIKIEIKEQKETPDQNKKNSSMIEMKNPNNNLINSMEKLNKLNKSMILPNTSFKIANADLLKERTNENEIN